MTEPTKGPYRAMRAHGTMRLPPGFWEVDILDSDNHPVGWAVGNTREQAEANAHLLAAAPALREAIERKLADCREHGDCSDAALMPGEYCSNECVALASALAQADGKETKNEHAK